MERSAFVTFFPFLTPLQFLTICLDPGFCLLIFTYSRFWFLTWVLTHCFLETLFLNSCMCPTFLILAFIPCSPRSPGYPYRVWLWYQDALIGNVSPKCGRFVWWPELSCDTWIDPLLIKGGSFTEEPQRNALGGEKNPTRKCLMELQLR